MNSFDNFCQHGVDSVATAPVRIIGLKPTHVGDPPNVIAGTVLVRIGPIHCLAGKPLAGIDCLDQRTVGVAAAADIINGAGAWCLNILPERVD